MASAGLVFLLLMSSSLLVTTVSSSPTDDKQEISSKDLNKVKEGLKATGMVIIKNIDNIRQAVCPFLGLIPVYGPLISAVVTFAGLGVSVINKNINDKPILEALNNEFESLNSKLDNYHLDQKWDSWASGAYYKPEIQIKTAWTMYTTLTKSILNARNEDEIQRHKEEFMTAYMAYEPATKLLSELLKPEGTSLIKSLGDLLAEHVNCHENDIRDYTIFIQNLIYKGNTMNHFYYNLKKITSEAKVDEEAKIAYEAGSVMFQVHKRCIINSMMYIKKDVEDRIKLSATRQSLAIDVRSFLEKAYDRHDWMVVAFITKKSSHKIIETLNSHVLSGFTEVTKEGVSVAVARQVKGTHTKGVKVKDAIDKCIDNSVLCYQVADKLKKCSESVEGIPVFQTYTAIHAYLFKAHDSHNAQQAPDEDFEFTDDPDGLTQIPYISAGTCSKSLGVKGGKFVVLIKSDEEMLANDPCSKLNCGGKEKGECVPVDDTFRAVCQCNYPYFGHQCEQSLDEYKNLLKKSEILVVDKRRRTNPHQ